MIENLFDTLSNLLYQNFWLASLSALGWGILSIILSPCHLSSIPLIIGFLSSQGDITLKRTFNLSLVFAIGILITIALIGIITLSLGRLMGDVGSIGNYIVAVVFFVVGLYLLDVIRLPWDGAKMSGTRFKGLIAALILGLIFGIGLGPCTFAFMAPILGVVFQVSSTDIILAISLLVAFSLGHAFVIVLAGTLTKKVQQYLNWTENSKTTKYIKRICGILVILGGVYLIYNTF
ncbi:MAG: cytochrome C biogenesis protein [Ignavibacteria bacterium GWB2_35_12]|nr:MAG: cytochrome C biogenesis protein [Ignavibacteria bacterium GWB2_35_12]OGU87889.1 MAG: cytochrome C biogenesis protein [Ignavibacteria bacterium RIFOXYA2_FULL_35_10]OGV21750.1 MAG: cytochrome C biogenesis protein [Ignavibacteria bacterium RIFOXYC2_FULL_35_21]